MIARPPPIGLDARRIHIFCDFDGTISRCDTTDLILQRFADPRWEEIEADWVAGRIDAASCMRQQIALIGASWTEIDALLDGVPLRAGFVTFLDWARRRSMPVTVVSDGVDYFIHRILARHGISDLPIIANRLVQAGPGWSLDQPWRAIACTAGSGVCKCTVVSRVEDDRTVVFVGDGRSDFCVATKPDILFATAGLERFCVERAIHHHPFNSFTEIQATLETIADDRPRLIA